MDKEKKEVIKLLTEIDTICKRQGIPYYLSPQLTLCGVSGQGIPNPFAGNIYMRTEDMERFRLAVAEEAPDRRIVESMNNNKHFWGFYLRYVDQDTLCFRLNDGRNYKYRGMSVNIYPLRGEKAADFKLRWNKAQEIGWNGMADSWNGVLGKKKRLCRMWVKCRTILGRGRLGRSLYRSWCKNWTAEGADRYILILPQKTLYFPKEIFDETGYVELEGVKFPVPEQTDAYLKKYYGSKYESKTFSEYSVKMNEMVSARVSYEDYFQEIGKPERLLKEHFRSKKVREKAIRKKAYLERSWSYVKECAAGLELEKQYLEQKDYLMNLYRNHDYAALSKAFTAYRKVNEERLQRNEIFVADEELERIFLDMLEKTGRSSLKNRIEKFWI